MRGPGHVWEPLFMSETPITPQPGPNDEPQSQPSGTVPPSSPPPPQPQPQPAGGYAPPLGPVPMLESEARTISMWIHYASAIAALISAGTLGFAVPLVMWLIYRERSALVDFHGKQNLNLQLTALLVGISAVVLGVITIGFGFLLTGPLWLAYAIYALVVSFLAGAAAQRGEYYQIKFAIAFVK